MPSRKVYPTDVTDEEWAFAAPYLTLMKEDAPQRVHALRDVFDAVRWMAKAACPWRLLPGDFPPWFVVEQQSKRWIAAGVFEALTHDLRVLARRLQERAAQPSAAIFDGRTLQSSPESGARAGYDGYKRKKGSKLHVAVDTLGHLLALVVTPANEQERAQVAALAEQVQAATEQNVELALRGSGLHRPTRRRRRRRARHPTGSGQTGRRQARLRAFAPPLGSRTILCLAGAFSAAVARLRTAANDPCRTTLAGFFVPAARQLVQGQRPKLMTASRPLFVTLLLSAFLSSKRAQIALLTSSALYCAWFVYAYVDIFYIHLDPQSAIGLLFGGVFSLPIMAVFWITAGVLQAKVTPGLTTRSGEQRLAAGLESVLRQPLSLNSSPSSTQHSTL